MALVAGGASCPRSSSRPPLFVGQGGDLDRRPRDPGQADRWDRLQQARAADPASDEVLGLAEEILAAPDVPLPMRLAALRAKAEHAYLHQQDAQATAVAEQGLALVEPAASGDAQVVVDLARIRARALVRGGDPALAVAALDDPRVHARGGLDPKEERGLRAIAADRNADVPGAVVALAAWRELLPDGDPTALWVEQRLGLLIDGLDPESQATLVTTMPDSAARDCLRARQGQAPPEDASPWVKGCQPSGGGIGVLLPRSGPFAAFADEQLAGALAAVEVLRGADETAPGLVWRDSGSSEGSARRAARALVDGGTRVVVGPVGSRNVKAVAQEVGGEATLIVPGEGGGKARGVAPSIEARVRALVDLARADGRDRIVVLAPDNRYGRRAAKAVKQRVGGKLSNPVVIRMYPPSTTSFGPHVNPVMTALRSSSALIIPDTLARTELVVRQLARSGRIPAHDDVPGLMVLATAEGITPQGLSRAGAVLDGVWVVPVAPRGPAAAGFVGAYARQQGEPPGDQALLVFYALEQAITGQPGPLAGRATVTRVQGGRLVVQDPDAP